MDNRNNCNANGDCDYSKIIRPCRHISNLNNIYLTHSQTRNTLKDSSLHHPIPTCPVPVFIPHEEVQKGRSVKPDKGYYIPTLKINDDSRECCTQTSKTILELAKMEEERMSPDSLTESPKALTQAPKILPQSTRVIPNTRTGTRTQASEHISTHVIATSTNSLDGMVNNRSDICAKASKCVPVYIAATSNNSLDGSVTEENVSVPFRRKGEIDGTVEIFRQKSLTETFLNKNKNRCPQRETDTVYFNSNLSSESSSLGDDNRSKFLQQTSPFRNLIKEDSLSKQDLLFKSQSFVEAYHPNYIYPYETKKKRPPQVNRFTIKSVSPNEGYQSDVKPVRYYCNKELTKEDVDLDSEPEPLVNSPRHSYQNKRSNSFMSPTIASQKKNQLPEVHNIQRLISPTHRGRSLSPVISNQVEKLGVNSKVPYIDRSESNVYQNINRTDRSENGKKRISPKLQPSPKITSPVLSKPGFDERLMKIDTLSLNIRSSEDTLSISDNLDSNSVYSSDNIIGSALYKIKDRDWNVALKGLAEVTELCRVLDSNSVYPHMTTVNQRLIELLRSPRSHVCRTACQAAGHLFESMKDTRRPEFDDIVNILLFKTADANKFIRQDANLALDCMVTHICTFHAVRALCCNGPDHKNPLVRTATARLLVCSVVIAGVEHVMNRNNSEQTRKRIFQHIAKFVDDRNSDTRKYGERLYKILSKEPQFDMYLKKYLEREEIADMKKKLKFNARK